LPALAVSASAQEDASARRDAETAQICAEAQERQTAAGIEPPPAGMALVLMYKDHFCPSRLELAQGTVIRFFNVEKRSSHSVWFRKDGLPESRRLFPEEYLDVSVDLVAGMHELVCGPHPSMTAQIIVRNPLSP
jgi:plastocyanin